MAEMTNPITPEAVERLCRNLNGAEHALHDADLDGKASDVAEAAATLRALARELAEVKGERDAEEAAHVYELKLRMETQADLTTARAQAAAAAGEMRDRCANAAWGCGDAWTIRALEHENAGRPVLAAYFENRHSAADWVAHEIEALPIPDTDALSIFEAQTFSAGYEAGERDGFNAGIEAVAALPSNSKHRAASIRALKRSGEAG